MTSETQTGTVLLVAGSANFSTRDVWDGYRVALQQIGLQVIPYSTFSFLKLLSVDAVCNDIIGTAVDQNNRIDYAIFVDGLYFRGQRARVPLSIRRAGIPTVLIATEDPYTTIPHTESLYTYRFTNEITCACKGISYLPTATLPPPELATPPAPTYDVSFLGTVFEDRAATLLRVAEYCESHRLRFLVAGKILGDAHLFDRFSFTDVRLGTIDASEKWRIYSQSKVTLNVFRESETAQSPNPRIFETTAFGHATLISGPERDAVTEIYGDSIYQYRDDTEITDAIDSALNDLARNESAPNVSTARASARSVGDEGQRKRAHAKSITLQHHTYRHRAKALFETLREPLSGEVSQERLTEQTAWIIGCGRTGSTWLAEMLGDVRGIRRWHEPYFGRLFRHLHERPDELERNASFFSRRQQPIWMAGIRDLFYSVARDRFPQIGRHALVVKEVNTPEIYPWIHAVFPQSRMIFLARDPFDVLDSYLDLQRPGSWNQKFANDGDDPLEPRNVRRTAVHIHSALTAAMDAFERFPEGQRLWVTYEDLLDQPTEQLRRCAELVGRTPEIDELDQVVQSHRFEKNSQTGPLHFRRHGKANVWASSTNFTGEVRQIAGEVLGKLRVRLGYQLGTATEQFPTEQCPTGE